MYYRSSLKKTNLREEVENMKRGFWIVLVGVLVSNFLIGGIGAQEKVTVRWLFETDFGGGWKVLIENFEKAHPGIKVEMQEGPSATNIREDMYSTSFMAGETTYDMAYADLIWVPKFAAAGWIIPLGDRITPYEIAQFLPGDIAGGMYQGKLYRVPSQSDAGMLYYRKDILDEAGFEPPLTWDELIEQAQKLQNPPDLWGFVWQGNQYEGLICDYLELLWSAGGELLDVEGRVVLDQGGAAVEALQFLYDVIHTYKISPPGVTTYQEEESRHVFHNGQAVFHRNWPYVWTLAQKEDSPIRGKVGITPMVHKKGFQSAATQGGWGWVISKFSKNQEAAWEWIKFATSYDSQKTLHFYNGYIPTRHALFADPDILRESPHYPDLWRVQINARTRPQHPQYAQISDILQRNIHAGITGSIAPGEAIKRAAQEIRELLGQ